MARFASWLLVALAVPAMAVAHGGVGTAKRSVEASMLVTGEIAVNPDGSVYGYSLDRRDKLPPAVVNLIGQTLTGWKFTPVRINGRPELAKALMSLRIVAKQIDDKHDSIRVASAAFGAETAHANTPPACADRSCLAYIKRSSPSYPHNLVDDFVSGTVYLAIEVNRLGKVAQVAVEQVNLRRLADRTTLDRWRRELGQASMEAARSWAFSVPQTGPEADMDHWIVMVPINYSVRVTGTSEVIGMPGYGQWDAYVPGPVNSIPWLQKRHEEPASNGTADAIPENGTPFIADARFVLLTPLGGDGAGKISAGTNPGPG